MIAARKPEIMSPAGYWPQLRTAIEAGADSVYFGLKHFTARAKVGFDLGELPISKARNHEPRGLLAAVAHRHRGRRRLGLFRPEALHRTRQSGLRPGRASDLESPKS